MTRNRQENVDIWFWDNGDFEAQQSELLGVLSADEHVRRSKKVCSRQGVHWAISRGRVRTLLAARMQMPASEIAFEANQFGHLSIANPSSAPIHFSISHAGSITALAVCDALPLGIDIERHTPLTDDEMDWPLSQTERRDLATVSAQDRQSAFFRYWTLKEAYIKAIGLGVSFPLGDFSMSPFGAPPALLHVAGDEHAPKDWTFCVREILPDVDLALAIKTEGLGLNYTYHAKNGC